MKQLLRNVTILRFQLLARKLHRGNLQSLFDLKLMHTEGVVARRRATDTCHKN